jgi:hypothetical protein
MKQDALCAQIMKNTDSTKTGESPLRWGGSCTFNSFRGKPSSNPSTRPHYDALRRNAQSGRSASIGDVTCYVKVGSNFMDAERPRRCVPTRSMGTRVNRRVGRILTIRVRQRSRYAVLRGNRAILCKPFGLFLPSQLLAVKNTKSKYRSLGGA